MGSNLRDTRYAIGKKIGITLLSAEIVESLYNRASSACLMVWDDLSFSYILRHRSS
jgi:hypothetical protein